MTLHVNVRSGEETIVALYFETHQGAPFVVKNATGGYPQFVVPWREGARKRAANRYELLRILVPIRRFAGLIDELNFNLEVAKAAKTIDHAGALFREDEFHRTLSDGALSSLPIALRKSVTDAYVSVNRANQFVAALLAVPSQHRQPMQQRETHSAVSDCLPLLSNALLGLSRL